MKAVMLAAGVGRRLYGEGGDPPPKALLEFGGRTLLERHMSILKELGVAELVMVLGHRRDQMFAAAEAAAGPGFVRAFFNPRYLEGPVISLWTARDVLRGGDDILFMDADVLYHSAVMERLVRSRHPNCFIYDRDFEPGDEPVKLCLKNGYPVEFGKKVEGEFDSVGEWPGFLKMSPAVAAKLADATQTYMDRGDFLAPYEPAMRDVIKSEPPGMFGVEDITGFPWIEIDFPADVMRAAHNIYPRLFEAIPADASSRPSPRRTARADVG